MNHAERIAKIQQLRKDSKRYRANANRQRRREEIGLPTRVSSSFWDQARRDADRAIGALVGEGFVQIACDAIRNTPRMPQLVRRHNRKA